MEGGREGKIGARRFVQFWFFITKSPEQPIPVVGGMEKAPVYIGLHVVRPHINSLEHCSSATRCREQSFSVQPPASLVALQSLASNETVEPARAIYPTQLNTAQLSCSSQKPKKTRASWHNMANNWRYSDGTSRNVEFMFMRWIRRRSN